MRVEATTHLPPLPEQYGPLDSPRRHVETLCGQRDSDWIARRVSSNRSDLTCSQCKRRDGCGCTAGTFPCPHFWCRDCGAYRLAATGRHPHTLVPVGDPQ